MFARAVSAVQSILPEHGQTLAAAKDGARGAARDKVLQGLTPAERVDYAKDCIDYERARKDFINKSIHYSPLHGGKPPEAPEPSKLMQTVESRASKLVDGVRERLLSQTSPEEKKALEAESKALERYAKNASSIAPILMAFPDQKSTLDFEKRVEGVIRELPVLPKKPDGQSAGVEIPEDISILRMKAALSQRQLNSDYTPAKIAPNASPAEQLAAKYEAIAVSLGVSQQSINEKKDRDLKAFNGNKDEANLALAEYCAIEIKSRVRDKDFQIPAKKLEQIAADMGVENKYWFNTESSLRSAISKGVDQLATLTALEAMDKHGFKDDVRYGWKKSPVDKIEFLRSNFELNATDNQYTLGVMRSLASSMGINDPNPQAASTSLKSVLQKDSSGEYLMTDPYQVIRNVKKNQQAI